MGSVEKLVQGIIRRLKSIIKILQKLWLKHKNQIIVEKDSIYKKLL